MKLTLYRILAWMFIDDYTIKSMWMVVKKSQLEWGETGVWSSYEEASDSLWEGWRWHVPSVWSLRDARETGWTISSQYLYIPGYICLAKVSSALTISFVTSIISLILLAYKTKVNILRNYVQIVHFLQSRTEENQHHSVSGYQYVLLSKQHQYS